MILHRFPLTLEGENGLEAAILEWFGTAEYIILLLLLVVVVLVLLVLVLLLLHIITNVITNINMNYL